MGSGGSRMLFFLNATVLSSLPEVLCEAEKNCFIVYGVICNLKIPCMIQCIMFVSVSCLDWEGWDV